MATKQDFLPMDKINGTFFFIRFDVVSLWAELKRQVHRPFYLIGDVDTQFGLFGVRFSLASVRKEGGSCIWSILYHKLAYRKLFCTRMGNEWSIAAHDDTRRGPLIIPLSSNPPPKTYSFIIIIIKNNYNYIYFFLGGGLWIWVVISLITNRWQTCLSCTSTRSYTALCSNKSRPENVGCRRLFLQLLWI